MQETAHKYGAEAPPPPAPITRREAERLGFRVIEACVWDALDETRRDEVLDVMLLV